MRGICLQPMACWRERQVVLVASNRWRQQVTRFGMWDVCGHTRTRSSRCTSSLTSPVRREVSFLLLLLFVVCGCFEEFTMAMSDCGDLGVRFSWLGG